MATPKQGIYLLAYYLNADVDDVKEYEYQPHHFTQKVFSLNGTYYCPYKTRPSYRYGEGAFPRENWVCVENIPSPYEESIIWKYVNPEEN